MKARKTLGILLGVATIVFGVALVARGDHPATSDAGVDVAWTEAMNQEAYWETLWGVECTKYEGHAGSIPASADAAVIKSGSEWVHVYADLTTTGAFTAVGPPNPNDQHPNRRHTAPFSWVMKCTLNQTTTTITEEPTTTTTVLETTTTVEPTTTTTATESSSTTTVLVTTTQDTGTTTSVPSVTPTTAGLTPGDPELPYTGAGSIVGLLLAASALIGGGWQVVKRGRGGSH